jgi:hypothetical protein
VFSFREWLYILRTDGKPRALRLPLFVPNTVKFIEDIIEVNITNNREDSQQNGVNVKARAGLLAKNICIGIWPSYRRR